MKLYDVKPKTKVKLLEDAIIPPAARAMKKDDVIYFDHIDGMYSYCLYGEEVVHIAAWTDVEIIDAAP